jgi:hypothetical protein
MITIFEEWRKFVNEGTVKYGGILMIKPGNIIVSELEALQLMLPEEAVKLSPEDFHVTLIHQSVLKPFRKEIKSIDLPTAPPIILDNEVFERTSPGKKSWAVRLQNQDEMREYVNEVMELLGSDNTNPEPERVFHVSLANLTGEPRDSVK